jgi:putative endonuclease
MMSFFCFIPSYVYIIQSHFDGTYYKGFSENPFTRLTQHNAVMYYTSRNSPWHFIYIEELLT